MNFEIEDDLRVTEQASRWFGALLDGNEKRAEFFRWISESPRHVEEFLFVLADAQDVATLNAEQRARIEQLSREYKSTGAFGSNVVPVSQRALPSYESAHADEAQSAGLAEPLPAPAPENCDGKAPDDEWSGARGQSHKARWLTGVGAALLVAFNAVLWLSGAWDWETYSTTIGEQRAIELADGSVVHMNTDSTIAVRLTDTSRDVRLTQGQALFTVKHDAGRPFLVHVEDTVIQAIGTRFDVYRRPNNTRVSVIEGVVRIQGAPSVAAPDEPERSSTSQRLTAGEAADISGEGDVARLQAVDAAKAVAWRQRRLVFEQSTLGEIATEFNRYNPSVKIRVVGESAMGERFSGTFDADAPEAMMQALTGDAKWSVERIGNEIVIRARETP